MGHAEPLPPPPQSWAPLVCLGGTLETLLSLQGGLSKGGTLWADCPLGPGASLGLGVSTPHRVPPLPPTSMEPEGCDPNLPPKKSAAEVGLEEPAGAQGIGEAAPGDFLEHSNPFPLPSLTPLPAGGTSPPGLGCVLGGQGGAFLPATSPPHQLTPPNILSPTSQRADWLAGRQGVRSGAGGTHGMFRGAPLTPDTAPCPPSRPPTTSPPHPTPSPAKGKLFLVL